MLLIQAFRRKFIIPEFDVFVKKINKIYDEVEKSSDGKVSVCSFVPDALSEAEPSELKGSDLMHYFTLRHIYRIVVNWVPYAGVLCILFVMMSGKQQQQQQHVPPITVIRLQTTFLSWPNSILSCGVCLCARWTANGKMS